MCSPLFMVMITSRPTMAELPSTVFIKTFHLSLETHQDFSCDFPRTGQEKMRAVHPSCREVERNDCIWQASRASSGLDWSKQARWGSHPSHYCNNKARTALSLDLGMDWLRCSKGQKLKWMESPRCWMVSGTCSLQGMLI